MFRPSKRWRNTNRAWKNKDAKRKQETLDHFALKVDQLRTMALGGDKVASAGGVEIKQSKKGLGFTETAPRQKKRSDFMSPHRILSKDPSKGPVLSDAMREKVHKELEAEVRKDKGSKHRARATTWEDLPAYKQENAVRAAMRGYDLDHVRDLQFGGKDALNNLQWLERSANRSVGAQAKAHRMKYGYVQVEDLDSLNDKSRINMVSHTSS